MSTYVSPTMSTSAVGTSVQAGGHTATPAFGRVRRLVVRRQAARVADAMIRDLLAVPQPFAGRPRFARLDALTARYEALGGDPSDLVR